MPFLDLKLNPLKFFPKKIEFYKVHFDRLSILEERICPKTGFLRSWIAQIEKVLHLRPAVYSVTSHILIFSSLNNKSLE